MLRPRIIPCLLVQNKGLVKTVNFKNPKYVGDPINAVRIFNEKEVDEIMVLDIDATRENREPDFRMIENLAAECRMPLCYGGGVKTIAQVKTILGLGVEKIAISSAAVEDPNMLVKAAELVGSQSIVVVLDVKKSSFLSKYEIWIRNGLKNTKKDAIEIAIKMENLGVGEIVINSIDKDGTMTGYDVEIVDKIRQSVDVPLTVLGGAGKLDHLRELIDRYKVIGLAAGSLFVFKGVYRAVLINYPTRAEKDALLQGQLKLRN